MNYFATVENSKHYASLNKSNEKIKNANLYMYKKACYKQEFILIGEEGRIKRRILETNYRREQRRKQTTDG